MAIRDRQKRVENRKQLKKLNTISYSKDELIAEEKKLLNIDDSKNVYIETPFQFDYGTNLHFSGDFYANIDCTFLDTGEIYFGKNVTIGPNVKIYTSFHPIEAQKRLTSGYYITPVKLGDNVWIGGGAIINPGVIIGENSVVASGSVVTKSVPPNVMVAGVPARIIKKIDNKDYYESKESL